MANNGGKSVQPARSEAESTIQAIEERREKRRAELDQKRLVQRAKDLEALDELEAERGVERLVRIELARYAEGCPTMVVFGMPEKVQAKRFQDMSRDRGDKKGDTIEAARQLAEVLVIYPARDSELWSKTKETFTFVCEHGALEAIKAAQGKAAEEGKG